MNRLSLDQLRTLLPESELLRPLLDQALSRSAPDPHRIWATSGELATLGSRVVAPGELNDLLPEVVERVRRHAEAVLGPVTRALDAVARKRWDEAISALLEAAEAEVGAGRVTQGWALIQAALGLRDHLPNRLPLLPALLAGARVKRSLGQFESADDLYAQACALSDHSGKLEVAARAWTGRGNLAVDRGLWALALTRYDEAEARVAEAPTPLSEEWHIPLNRSIVARRRGELDRAREELDRARSRAQAHSDPGKDAFLWNAEGQLREAAGEPAAAEEAFRLALADAATPDARAVISLNLAQLLTTLNRTLEAGELARGAEREVLRSGILSRLPEVYRVLGQVASANGSDEALVFFEQALEVIRSWKLPEVERARTLEAYGRWELLMGSTELGVARLTEARELFRVLGCAADDVRLTTELDSSINPERSTDAPDQQEK